MSNPLVREDRDYTLNEDFPLRKQQNDGVHFLLTKFNAVLNHQTGLGKCVPGDVRIQTDLGYKKIKDLCDFREDGEYEDLNIKVSTRGGIKNTSNFYFEEDCIVKELVLSNGYKIKGTLEHKVLSQNNNSNVKLIKLDDIDIGDNLLLSHNKRHWSTNANNNLSKWENYLLGLYVGDGGSIEYEKRTRRYYLTGRYKILSMIKDKLNLSLKIYKDKRREDNHTLYLSTENEEHTLISNYLGNEGSVDKYIPEIIFEGSRYQKLSFILGYLDADGSFSEPTLEFTSKSKVLINQLQDLLNSVGIHMYIGKKEIRTGKYEGNIYWRLSSIGHTLYNFSDIDNFSDSYKLKSIHNYIKNREIINAKNPIKFNDNFVEKNARDLMDMILPYKDDRSKYLYRLIKNGRRVVTEDMLRYLNRNGDLVGCFKQFIGYSYLEVVDINYYREDVYDLTVPDGHEFMAQGLANHNTFTSLTAAQHVMNELNNSKTIIFCPKKANSSFEKELNEKLKKPYSKYETGDIIEEENPDYYIYNYMSMHKYLDDLVEMVNDYKVVAIIDEAHKLQNPKTRISKVLKHLRPAFNCKFLLTATPLLNDIKGLYYVVEFVKPDFFGTYTSFEKKYLKTKLRKIRRGGRLVRYKEIVGEKNIDHLRKRLKEVIQVRKKEYDLDFHYRKVKMSEQMEREYIRAAKGIIDEDYNEDDVKDFAPRLHDLQRVVDNVQKEMESLPLSNKEKLLLKTSKEILDREEGLIIYVDYRATEERLEEVLEGYKSKLGFDNLYKITGSVNQADRNMVEKELSSRDVVLITEAGAESINLRQVNNILFYDLPFAVGTVIQCLTGKSRLLTKEGYIKINDIEDNGEVWTGDKWVNYRILKKEKSKLVKVTMDSGREVVCSEDHKFKDSNMEWVDVKNLEEGDVVAKPYKNKFNFEKVDRIEGDLELSLINIDKENIVWEDDDLLDLFYLVGYIIGDGWITLKKRNDRHGGMRNYVEICFGYHEIDRKNKIKKIIEGWGFTVLETVYKYDDENKKDTYTLSVYDYRLTSAMIKLGMDVNTRFDTKKVPDIMFRCSSKQRIQFIKGVYDSDGSKQSGQFHMNNKELLQQISLLLELEGIVSKVKKTSGAWLLYLIGGRVNNKFKNILDGDLDLKDTFVLEGDYYKQYLLDNLPDMKPNRPSWVIDGVKRIKKGKNISPERIEKLCRYFDIDLRVLRGGTIKEICDRFYMVYKNIYLRKQPKWVKYAKYDMKRRNISYDTYERLLEYYNIQKPDEWYFYDKVEKVEKLDEIEDVYYIEVDDDKHQYVADGYIHKNCIGRITRMDTEYDNQNVYFLEVEDTIDSYKRITFQNNTDLIKKLFGGNSNLPSNVKKVDRNLMKYVRKELLWKFKDW